MKDGSRTFAFTMAAMCALLMALVTVGFIALIDWMGGQ